MPAESMKLMNVDARNKHAVLASNPEWRPSLATERLHSLGVNRDRINLDAKDCPTGRAEVGNSMPLLLVGRSNQNVFMVNARNCLLALGALAGVYHLVRWFGISLENSIYS